MNKKTNRLRNDQETSIIGRWIGWRNELQDFVEQITGYLFDVIDATVTWHRVDFYRHDAVLFSWNSFA